MSLVSQLFFVSLFVLTVEKLITIVKNYFEITVSADSASSNLLVFIY
jgi:hypothetical protein